MDWVTVIRKEAQTSSILRRDELARKYGIIPAAVTQALSRHEQKGLVEHVSNKIYYNWLALDGSPVIWSMFCVIMPMSRLIPASVNTESVRSLLVHSLA
jgi:hypothetical protein